MKIRKMMFSVICLVVFSIFSIILLTPKFVSAPGQETAVHIYLAEFKDALTAFHNDCGVYPSTTNGLTDLINQPPGVNNWHGPYLKYLPDRDPWAQEYIYSNPGQHTAEGYPYDLMSLGPPGEHRPIANWMFPNLKP
jgi:general secretion pathway protein G